MEFSNLVNLATSYGYLAEAAVYKVLGEVKYRAKVMDLTFGVETVLEVRGDDLGMLSKNCMMIFVNIFLNKNTQLQ